MGRTWAEYMKMVKMVNYLYLKVGDSVHFDSIDNMYLCALQSGVCICVHMYIHEPSFLYRPSLSAVSIFSSPLLVHICAFSLLLEKMEIKCILLGWADGRILYTSLDLGSEWTNRR